MELYGAILVALTAANAAMLAFAWYSSSFRAYTSLTRRLEAVEAAFPEWKIRMEGLSEAATDRLESAEQTLEDGRSRLRQAQTMRAANAKGNGPGSAPMDAMALLFDQNQPPEARLAAMKELRRASS